MASNEAAGDSAMDRIAEELRKGFLVTNDAINSLASLIRSVENKLGELARRVDDLEEKKDREKVIVKVSVQDREWQYVIDSKHDVPVAGNPRDMGQSEACAGNTDTVDCDRCKYKRKIRKKEMEKDTELRGDLFVFRGRSDISHLTSERGTTSISPKESNFDHQSFKGAQDSIPKRESHGKGGTTQVVTGLPEAETSKLTAQGCYRSSSLVAEEETLPGGSFSAGGPKVNNHIRTVQDKLFPQVPSTQSARDGTQPEHPSDLKKSTHQTLDGTEVSLAVQQRTHQVRGGSPVQQKTAREESAAAATPARGTGGTKKKSLIFKSPTGGEYAGTYEKMKGAANNQGTRYEYKLATLLFLRCLGQADEFQLATNAKAAGKFDDIVLRYRSSAVGPERVLLIQLKHKMDDSFTITRDKLSHPGKRNSFFLGDYFRSYVATEADLKHQAYFVLYTNATVQQRPSTCIRRVDEEVQNILDTGGRDGCVCTFDYDADYDVISTFVQGNHTETERFLERFVLFSNQANEKHLDILIQQEMIKILNIITPEIVNVYRNFLEGVQKWWETDSPSGEVSFITKQWRIWEEIHQLVKSKVTPLTSIQFTVTEANTLRESIFESECQTVAVVDFCGATENLRCLKLLQALKGQGESFLLVSENDCWETLEMALELWVGGRCDVLAVDVSAGPQRHDDLCSRLCMTLREDWGRRKVLVLAGSGQSGLVDGMSKELGRHWGDEFDAHWRRARTTCEFQQLDDKSQDHLRGRSIMFQGYNLSVTALQQDHILDKVLTGQDLSTYLNVLDNYMVGRTIKVNENVHIERRLQRGILIKKDVLKRSDISDVFYISGITSTELRRYVATGRSIGGIYGKSKKIRYFVRTHKYTSPAEEFGYYQSGILDTNIHWLDYHVGFFKWQESRGSTHQLWPYLEEIDSKTKRVREQMQKYKTSFFDVQGVIDIGERVVLVIGEPGMGKTVLLTRVANTIKKRRPHSCVIKVNLNEITKSLEEMSQGAVTPEAILDILRVATGVQTSTSPRLAEALLVECVQGRGDAIVLLDAYDEISPTYNDVVMNILKALLDYNVSQLWVTSRPIMKEELENALGTTAFTLQDFTRDQQISFLVKYWQSKVHSELLNDVNKFAERLIARIYKDIPLDRGHPISSVPLHTMIIAEAYEQNALSIHFDDDIKSVNLLYLFKKFVDKRESIYFKEKLGVDCSKSGVSKFVISDRKKFMHYHMMSALVVVLNPTELSFLHVTNIRDSVREFVHELAEGEEKTGIIVGVVNGEPSFIHKTFAEYFVALWLAEHYGKNPRAVERILFDARFLVVRHVFDLALAQNCPLHMAVLNGTLKEGDADLMKDVDALDDGRRTALHLAASKSREMAALLADRGANLEFTDGVLGLTPIYHAARAHAWSTVVRLLEKGSRVKKNVAELEMVQQALEDVHSKWPITKLLDLSRKCFDVDWPIFSNVHSPSMTIMNIAALSGNFELFQLLLKEGGTVENYTQSGKTLLLCGVRGGSREIVRSLLESEADANYQDTHGRTPLHMACILKQGQLAALMVQRGANSNIRSMTGRTPLHEAALGGCVDIMQVIIDGDGGATVNAQDDFSITPLHLACKRKHKRAVRTLMANGAEGNPQNWRGRSPLHMSIRSGHVEIVRTLMECGTNIEVDAEDVEGYTPLDLARKYGHTSLVRLLKGNPVETAPSIGEDKVLSKHAESTELHDDTTRPEGNKREGDHPLDKVGLEQAGRVEESEHSEVKNGLEQLVDDGDHSQDASVLEQIHRVKEQIYESDHPQGNNGLRRTDIVGDPVGEIKPSEAKNDLEKLVDEGDHCQGVSEWGQTHRVQEQIYESDHPQDKNDLRRTDIVDEPMGEREHCETKNGLEHLVDEGDNCQGVRGLRQTHRVEELVDESVARGTGHTAPTVSGNTDIHGTTTGSV